MTVWPISTPFEASQGQQIIEEQLPLSPIQRTTIKNILKSGLSHTTEINFAIEGYSLTSYDQIRYAWQAIASQNAALRTEIERCDDLDVVETTCQRVLRKPLSIQFCCSHSAKGSKYHQAAQMIVRISEGQLHISVAIHRALIDHASSSLLQGAFHSFISGFAFRRCFEYTDYIQQTNLKDHIAAETYWKTYLSGLVETPVHCYPLETSSTNSVTSIQLSKNVSDQLDRLAKAWHVPVRSLLYTAWTQVLLWHTEASMDSVSFAVMGRDLTMPRIETTVGLIDQVYPLRASVGPNVSVRQAAESLRDSDEESSAKAYVGYDAILKLSPGYRPSTLVLIESQKDCGEVPKAEMIGDRFQLVLLCSISAAGAITLSLQHDRVVSTLQSRVMLDHFACALADIVASPEQSLASVKILPKSEEDYLLQLARPVTDPVEGLVHHLFESQVLETPDLPAVQFETDTPLSYAQLNRVANAVARQLPCGRGSYVPVCMPRSAELIIIILAILKTGAAYVPLDPSVPTERNRFIFEDVSAPFAVVSEKVKDIFDEELVVEELIRRAPKYSDANLNVPQVPTDIVYVIYTSGSTGQPKGVLLEHRAAYTGLAAFPYLEDLRQLLFHNPVFSAAQRSVWSNLKQGGCLCLASKENLTVFIGDTINKMGINVIDVTPSTATLITPGTVPNLRRMTVAGELINPALIPEWIDRLELLNAYGLSENTQFNWRHVIVKGQNAQNIGRPSDTTTAYVLMPDSTVLAPLMVPGELCLGGHQLARGYLNRPEKTAQAFIDNPFGPGKLYRTGDLVVTQADGSVEMIGRIDFSIKINDQRVEPGESNAHIQMHPDVHDSAVVAAVISGRKCLVATVVPHMAINWPNLREDLRSQLAKHLPHYMIPSYWLCREELPLNVNGKVDVPNLRRICESLGRNGFLDGDTDDKEDPLSISSDELALRNLWADRLLIQPEEIRMSDSFLRIGGSSLDAIVICSKALKLGMRIELKDLIQGKTIPQLVQSKSFTGGDSSSSTIEPFSMAPASYNVNSSIEDVMPATPLQEGIMGETITGSSDYIYRRAFSFGGYSVDELRRAFELVVQQRPLLRTTLVAHGASFLQVVKKQSLLPWRDLDVELEAYLRREEKDFDIGYLELPLFGITILKSHICVVEIHHSLFDFWSNHFLLEDVEAALKRQKLMERPHFGHYIRYLHQVDKEAARVFWKGYLKDVSPTIVESNETGKGFSIFKSLGFDLQAVASPHGITPSALIYAAWATVLSAWTSSTDITFVVAISGRDAPIGNILEINGPTLATVPLRIQIQESKTLLDLAQEIVPGFWDVTKHAHLGLRNVLKQSGSSGLLCNVAANILVKPEIDEGESTLQHLEVPPSNTSEMLTIEADGSALDSLRLFSGTDFPDAPRILNDVYKVLSTTVGQADITIGNIIEDLKESRKENAKAVHLRELDDASDTSDAAFSHWKTYLSDIEPTILNFNPTSQHRRNAELAMLGPRNSKIFSSYSQDSIWYSAWSVVLAQHTNIARPVLAVCQSSETSGFTFLHTENPVDLTLGNILNAVDDKVKDKSRINLSFTQAALLLSQHNALDTVVHIRDKSNGSRNTALNLLLSMLPSRFTILDIDPSPVGVKLNLWTTMEDTRAQFILAQVQAVVDAMELNLHSNALTVPLVKGEEETQLCKYGVSREISPSLLHTRIEEHAAQRSDAIALQYETYFSFTYKELNARANQLAHCLAQKGVTERDIVPLFLERSPETIISILAVLKCGAAYVPLSPNNPADRNQYILGEVGARLVISHSQFQSFADLHRLTSVFVDKVSYDEYPDHNPGRGSPENLAYVIFTSGSTGTPKGVRVSHRAISTAVEGIIEAVGHDSTWKYLQFYDYVFDASVYDIFCNLSAGGTLCMASSERLVSDLAGVMREMGIKQTSLTPTVAKTVNPVDVPDLELMTCGGEALTDDVVNTWTNARRLINLYGPTEASVVATVKTMQPSTNPRNIGTPLSTVGLFVMSLDGTRLAPYGGVGEICLAGTHLAEGYINRDDLTSQAFVASPIPGYDRLYRTGDLGRWLPDQEIEYLGRIDHQIKLNGYRIELGEIENAIIQSGLAHDCVAMVLTPSGRPQLAAFCVFERSNKSLIEDAAEYKDTMLQLKQKMNILAHYMVPKLIFPIGSFPRQLSNKTDRKKLKAMAESFDISKLHDFSLEMLGSLEVEIQPPETAGELLLQKAWSDLFNIKKQAIGKSSNFFAIGGDSIAAINLVSVCRQAGYSLLVGDVLKHGTLEKIATRMKDSKTKKNISLAAERIYKPPQSIQSAMQTAGLSEVDVEYIYPCPAGQSEWLTQGDLVSQNWVVVAARPFPAEHDVVAYQELIKRLTSVNDILRTTFTRLSNHGWVGVVLREPVVDFLTLACDSETRESVLSSIQAHKFAFGQPFIRYILLAYPDGARELVIKASHGLWDGTSLRIFDQLMLELQEGITSPKNTEFKDFIFNEWRQDKSPSLEFWKSLLVTKQDPYPAAHNPAVNAVCHQDIDIKTEIDNAANSCGVTPAIVFQGIYQLCLRVMSGHVDAEYDYLLAGRNVDVPNPQTINGVCANFLPFRVGVDLQSDLKSYLADTQDFFWKATEHGDVSMDDAYAAAGLGREEKGNNSLFIFQPFEKPTGPPRKDMRWIVLALSEGRMRQPYALVEEISKTLSGYRLTIKFDDTFITPEEARGFAEHQIALIKKIVKADMNMKLSDLL